MPRIARFKIAALEQLLRQLEYAPPSMRRRHMDAAEQLIGDIDPGQNYPQEFITFRVTGYRPDPVEEPVTFVGQALLPDLINFVQVLSENLDLPVDYAGRTAVALEQVASRLNVSGKTLQRYRKQGLVCHYVNFGEGVRKLACFDDSLERFTSRRQSELHKAAAFTRVNGEIEAAIIEQARELHESERLSLNAAALRLAQRHGRAHETIRMLLRRHGRKAAQPIFSERGPLSERNIRLIHRAWRWGIEPAQLAEHFGKTKPTIHRAINRRRRDLLRTLTIEFVRLPTFDLPDAAEVILSSPLVAGGLNQSLPDQDGLQLIDAALQAATPAADLEDSLLAAYNFLKMRAASAIAALGEWPRSAVLEAIEADLRWAGLLHRRLVMLGFPAALRRIEQNLHRPLRDQPTDQIAALTSLAISVVAQTVEIIDPLRGRSRRRMAEQRLERIVSFAMERALVKLEAPDTSSRAAARHQAGSMPLNDPFGSLDPWQAWLNPRRDLGDLLPKLSETSRSAIIMRYGLEGGPPLTCRAMAVRLGMKPVGVARLLQKVQRELRAAATAGSIRSGKP